MVAASVHVIEEELRVMRKNNELACLNDHLAFIMENMSDGVIIVDKDGIITQVNPVAQKFLNLSREEILGSAIEDISGTAPATREMLVNGKAYHDVEIMFDSRGGDLPLPGFG